MPRQIHHDRMVSLFVKALGHGAERVSVSHARWNISGDCEHPYWTLTWSRPRTGKDPFRPDHNFTFVGGKMTMFLDIGTRCRRCDKCRRARFLLWRHRAREEMRGGARNWWGTLTLNPSEQFRTLSVARHLAEQRAVPWDSLSPDERFTRHANASLIDVTKYLKRIRKESKVPLRYLLVTEKHKSGLPHFHMLIHETELKPIRHKTLSTQWGHGFERWRLVQHDSVEPAAYVTKYIAKDALTRIRASLQYGREQPGIVGPLVASFRQIDDLWS